MLRADLPRKFSFLRTPARYKVAYGGRGGGKSWGVARQLLLLAAARPLRVLCARELQVSIQDSVHKLLSDQIQSLGLLPLFDVQQSTIRGVNGSEFIFSGIRSNVTKIKSMEGLDVVWVEEAEKVSKESWDVLIPTVRKPGSEIWVTFNPNEEKDPTYQRFVVQRPPGAVVVSIGWQDNPWFPEELQREKDYLYEIDPDSAEHIWGGALKKNSHATVLRGRWIVQAFEPGPDWFGPYFGADWGFANDPTTLVRCWVRDLRPPAERDAKHPVRRVLYVEHEAYAVGVDVDLTPDLFDRVPGSRQHTIRADNARPETISYMQRHGYPRVQAAAKGPGSVEDGIEHLRSYEQIVIHPRCTHAAEEARLWSFKIDPLTGDVLPVLVKKHDHVWDAARYALEPLIRANASPKKLAVSFAC